MRYIFHVDYKLSSVNHEIIFATLTNVNRGQRDRRKLRQGCDKLVVSTDVMKVGVQ